METYARHIVAEKWRRPLGETNPPMHPRASFHTLREAVAQADKWNAEAEAESLEGLSYEVWDIEHLHLGDMLQAEECRAQIVRFREDAQIRRYLEEQEA